jgi:hypothetical protein
VTILRLLKLHSKWLYRPEHSFFQAAWVLAVLLSLGSPLDRNAVHAIRALATKCSTLMAVPILASSPSHQQFLRSILLVAHSGYGQKDLSLP